MENIVPFQFHFFSTKWNGNGMEKKTEMKWKKKIIGMEWNWNGNGMENI